VAENSAISWTDHTFNPWWGCTKVGPGCDHCYAESFDKRVGGAHWGPGVPRREVKDWSKPRKWNREAERTGVRPWVFCASMADVFDNEVPTEWRERLWQLVRETWHLNWIFVTKRIGNAVKMLPTDWPENFRHCGLCSTIVNQEEADRDIPKLLATPAAWRGISAEPLLGPISFESAWHGENALDSECWGDCAWCKKGYPPLHNCQRGQGDYEKGRSGLDWIIVGGESGPRARPMHPVWARDIRDQCAAAGVSFHFKQWGEYEIAVNRDLDDPAADTLVPEAHQAPVHRGDPGTEHRSVRAPARSPAP
jgi:protein gp37